jgi:hypothetical protein
MTSRSDPVVAELISRMVTISDCDDTTGLAADALREGSEQLTVLSQRIGVLEEALEGSQDTLRIVNEAFARDFGASSNEINRQLVANRRVLPPPPATNGETK